MNIKKGLVSILVLAVVYTLATVIFLLRVFSLQTKPKEDYDIYYGGCGG